MAWKIPRHDDIQRMTDLRRDTRQFSRGTFELMAMLVIGAMLGLMPGMPDEFYLALLLMSVAAMIMLLGVGVLMTLTAPQGGRLRSGLFWGGLLAAWIGLTVLWAAFIATEPMIAFYQ